MLKEKNKIALLTIPVFFSIFLFSPAISFAGGAPTTTSLSLMPGRYVAVKDGDDAEKFKEDNWINDRFAAGIKRFNMESSLSDGTKLNIDAHGISGDNDYKFESLLTKENKYTLRMGYDKFRKFYDGTGGKYKYFTAEPIELDKDLYLNNSKFFVDMLFPFGEVSDVSFRYERKSRQGAKSMLNWGSFSGAGTSATRYINPAWKDIDENTDIFNIGTASEFKGFKLSLNQNLEVFGAETFKEIRTTSGFTLQDKDPRAKNLVTTFNAERHFSDKIFFASAYRFSHIDATEDEKLVTTTAARVLTGTSNYFNAFSENKFDTHTLTGNLLLTPWKHWSFGIKAKAETLRKKSASVYPKDTTNPPNFTIDDYLNSANKNSAKKLGEGFSIRYSGIARTALYLEGEGEQSRVRLREARVSSAGTATEVFNRSTIANVSRGSWTLGGHVSPTNKINITTQARQIYNYTDYDDQSESTNAGTALSAFTDTQRTRTDELSTKFAVKLLKQLQSALKYQHKRQIFLTGFEGQGITEAESYSHIYTAELNFTPTDKWLLSGSLSKQQVTTSTAARQSGGNATIPSYDANVDTFLLSADYTATNKLTIGSSYQWTGSANFNDISNTGMPYGLNNSLQHAKLSLNYALSPDASLGGSYGYHTYTEKSNAYIDDYIANVFEVNGTLKF